jgi:hypothetical protein
MIMSDPRNAPLPGTPGQLGWIRRASAVAMARGNHRPHVFGGTVLEDVRLDRIAGTRRPRGRRR